MFLKLWTSILAVVAAIPQTHAAIPLRRGGHRYSPKPVAFYLAGDSTTAAQSDEGGGWGVGSRVSKNPSKWCNWDRSGL